MKEFSVEDRGIYEVVHAPIRLNKECIRNDEYLKDFMGRLVREIKI